MSYEVEADGLKEVPHGFILAVLLFAWLEGFEHFLVHSLGLVVAEVELDGFDVFQELICNSVGIGASRVFLLLGLDFL